MSVMLGSMLSFRSISPTRCAVAGSAGRDAVREAETLELQARIAENNGDDQVSVAHLEQAMRLRIDVVTAIVTQLHALDEELRKHGNRLAAQKNHLPLGNYPADRYRNAVAESDAASTPHSAAAIAESTADAATAATARESVLQDFTRMSQALYAVAEQLVVRCNTIAAQRFRTGDFPTATALLDYCIELTRPDGYPLGEDDARRGRLRGLTLNNMGCMERRRGHYQLALQHMRESMACTGEESAVAYMNMSAIMTQLRLSREAATMAGRAVALLTARVPRSSQATTPVHNSATHAHLAVAHHNWAMALEPLNPQEAVYEYGMAYDCALREAGLRASVTRSIEQSWSRFVHDCPSARSLTPQPPSSLHESVRQVKEEEETASHEMAAVVAAQRALCACEARRRRRRGAGASVRETSSRTGAPLTSVALSQLPSYERVDGSLRTPHSHTRTSATNHHHHHHMQQDEEEDQHGDEEEVGAALPDLFPHPCHMPRVPPACHRRVVAAMTTLAHSHTAPSRLRPAPPRPDGGAATDASTPERSGGEVWLPRLKLVDESSRTGGGGGVRANKAVYAATSRGTEVVRAARTTTPPPVPAWVHASSARSGRVEREKEEKEKPRLSGRRRREEVRDAGTSQRVTPPSRRRHRSADVALASSFASSASSTESTPELGAWATASDARKGTKAVKSVAVKKSPRTARSKDGKDKKTSTVASTSLDRSRANNSTNNSNHSYTNNTNTMNNRPRSISKSISASNNNSDSRHDDTTSNKTKLKKSNSMHHPIAEKEVDDSHSTNIKDNDHDNGKKSRSTTHHDVDNHSDKNNHHRHNNNNIIGVKSMRYQPKSDVRAVSSSLSNKDSSTSGSVKTRSRAPLTSQRDKRESVRVLRPPPVNSLTHRSSESAILSMLPNARGATARPGTALRVPKPTGPLPRLTSLSSGSRADASAPLATRKASEPVPRTTRTASWSTRSVAPPPPPPSGVTPSNAKATSPRSAVRPTDLTKAGASGPAPKRTISPEDRTSPPRREQRSRGTGILVRNNAVSVPSSPTTSGTTWRIQSHVDSNKTSTMHTVPHTGKKSTTRQDNKDSSNSSSPPTHNSNNDNNNNKNNDYKKNGSVNYCSMAAGNHTHVVGSNNNTSDHDRNYDRTTHTVNYARDNSPRRMTSEDASQCMSSPSPRAGSKQSPRAPPPQNSTASPPPAAVPHPTARTDVHLSPATSRDAARRPPPPPHIAPPPRRLFRVFARHAAPPRCALCTASAHSVAVTSADAVSPHTARW